MYGHVFYAIFHKSNLNSLLGARVSLRPVLYERVVESLLGLTIELGRQVHKTSLVFERQVV